MAGYRKVSRVLLSEGWRVVRQRGSHVTFEKQGKNGRTCVTVPRHEPIAKGTLRDILRAARIPRSRLQRR